MKRALPIMLAVATLVVGAPTLPVLAQDAAPAPAQASDPEAAANEAYKAWKAETDPAKKFELGKQLVSQHPGSKAAEAVGYDGMFKPANDTQKYEMSKAYYDAATSSGKEGAYLEYALGNLATMEKDTTKMMDYGRAYKQKYPQGKFVKFVDQAMVTGSYNAFDAAVKAKNWPVATKIAEDAFASGQNEFVYAYRLAYAGLADETATGAKSPFVGKVSAWSDRAIQYVESGKVPEGAKPDQWNAEKPKTLATLYRAKAVDTYLRIAASNPTAPDALQPAVDEIKKALTKAEKDPALFFFLAQAYAQQYGIYSTQYSALTDEQKAGPEGQAQLAKVNTAADMVIDTYIKLIAYAGETSPVANDIKPKLAELWNFRHPDAPNGWQDEIKKAAAGGGAPAAAGTK